MSTSITPEHRDEDPIVHTEFTSHSTRSTPGLHIVYGIEVTLASGKSYKVWRRYREFTRLHALLSTYSPETPPELPSQVGRLSSPHAWLSDAIVETRKAGLDAYLRSLVIAGSPETKTTICKFLNENAKDKVDMAEMEQAQTAAAAVPVPFISAYYPDWVDLTPSQLPWSKLTHVFFAFAMPTASGGVTWDSGSDSTSRLKSLVSTAHSKGVKVSLSIGGWGGSQYFSNAVSSGRTAFVNTCKGLVNTYGLDGLDFDWEYPGESGAGNNYSASDASNYLAFFKALRAAVGTNVIFSVAVQTGRIWANQSSVASFSSYVDIVMIMNYDVNGASSTPGPNAPLSDACGDSSQPTANAVGGIAAWHNGGFPYSKLVLGLPAYSYVSSSSATKLRHFVIPDTPFPAPTATGRSTQTIDSDVSTSIDTEGGAKAAEHAHANSANLTKIEEAGSDVGATAAAGDLSSLAGQQVNFSDLLRLGAIKYNTSTGYYDGVNGNDKNWDDCSDTPFLVNSSRRTVITYDDPDSIKSKAAYAKAAGTAGVAFWEISGDDANNGWALLSAARKGYGV